MKHGMALCVLAVLIGSPARAQDGSEGAAQRTVESAQQFLVEQQQAFGAYLRYSIGVHLNTFLIDRRRARPDDHFEHVASWTVERIEPLERCVTRVHLRPGSQIVIGGSEFEPANMRVPDASIPPGNFVDLNWARVETHSGAGSARFQRGLGFRMFFPPAAQVLGARSLDLVFATDSQDVFSRAGFAVQFLVETCRPRSQTGF